MRLKLQLAAPDDAAELLALHHAVAIDLTERFGKGHWSSTGGTERGELQKMRHGKVLVARRRGRIIGSLRLVTKKPWAIDTAYFTKCKKPLYLLDMAVLPKFQGQGIGRACMDEARRFARLWPADAIRLDAYDAAAGAAPFYAKCGCAEVGRVVYRGTPLVYFETIL